MCKPRSLKISQQGKETLLLFELELFEWSCLQRGPPTVVSVQLKVMCTCRNCSIRGTASAGGCPNVKWSCCQWKSALGLYPGWRGFTSHGNIYWSAFHFILLYFIFLKLVSSCSDTFFFLICFFEEVNHPWEVNQLCGQPWMSIKSWQTQ